MITDSFVLVKPNYNNPNRNTYRLGATAHRAIYQMDV